jgi:hypothetical protein
MTGTAGSYAAPPVHGFAVLSGTQDLQPEPVGTWIDTALEVTLPEAGTYQLDANVHAAVSGVSEVNGAVLACLLDVTAGVIVPNSSTCVHQVSARLDPDTATLTTGGNQNAPISIEYTVTGPTVIRLQVQRNGIAGVEPTETRIFSDGAGATTLRYLKVGP